MMQAIKNLFKRHIPRILIVDDDRCFCEMVKTVLETEEFRCVAVNSGEDAVELYGKDPTAFDSVLLDIGLPGIDGSSVLQLIKSINPAQWVGVVSGHSDTMDMFRFANYKPDHIMEKPISLRSLKAAIINAMESNGRKVLA